MLCIEFSCLYREIAISISNSREFLYMADTYLLEAVNHIMNIANSNMSGGNGKAVSGAIFYPFYYAYVWSKKTVHHMTALLWAVRAINQYVEKNYFTNETDPLTYFVNNVVPWEDGIAPCYWAALSERLGYDTSTWPIDPSSCDLIF